MKIKAKVINMSLVGEGHTKVKVKITQHEGLVTSVGFSKY